MQTVGAQYRQERTRPRTRPGRSGEELGSTSDKARGDMLPKPEPAPAAAEPRPELEEKREKLERIGVWLLEHEPDNPHWGRGAAAYTELAEEIRALERGPLHFLTEPGDEYVGPPVEFPPDYEGPLVGGKWERLPDGRLLATGLTLFDLRVMVHFRNLAREARSLEEEPARG